jgi:hypothetical protein
MIRIRVTNEKTQTGYPKLMIGKDSGLIVLAKKAKGGCIHGTSLDQDSCGYYSETWIKDEFEDFDGEITLTND